TRCYPVCPLGKCTSNQARSTGDLVAGGAGNGGWTRLWGRLSICARPRGYPVYRRNWRVATPPVAVGTAVTRCPPHRPVLALLTHTVPTSETDTPKPFRLHVLPRHFSAPVFSGTVSSIGRCLGVSLADRLPSTGSADSPLPLFADLVGTMRPLDSPLPYMRDSWLIAFSPRPANCPRAATGSPGSRAWSFSACLGSSTPQGRAALALSCDALLPSLQPDAVGSLKRLISELNTQPTDTPVQRFGRSLAAALAWLGARAVRYAFPVRLFHSLLHAGLSRRIQVNNLPHKAVAPGSQASSENLVQVVLEVSQVVGDQEG